MVMNTNIKKKEISQIYNLLHLKELEKDQTKFYGSRKKVMIKIRAEMNELETRKTMPMINEIK